MVDFYKTSCGACKYLLPGFMKLCKAAYDRDVHPAVVFLKHNVFDDYEEEKTDLARRLQIQVRRWPQATCCLHAHLWLFAGMRPCVLSSLTLLHKAEPGRQKCCSGISSSRRHSWLMATCAEGCRLCMTTV